MCVWIATENCGSRLRVFIDYELPPTPGTRWLGFLFGGFYARWCVRQMLQSARGGWRPVTTTADSRRAMLPSPPSAGTRSSVLKPRSGERILEIGPGVGVHAQAIAAALRPDGVLDVVDVQHAMLDPLTRRARRLGLTNIVATQGDARTLPYPAGTFHAAYLVGVLGEVPDPVAALRELHRVLRPDGRLIIGELFLDPDFVSLPALRARGADAGLAFVRTTAPRFAYWAVFRPAGG